MMFESMVFTVKDIDMEKVKRYALDLDMYVYAANDIDAMEIAKTIEGFLKDSIADCFARAIELTEVPFGAKSFNPRKIELNNN